MKISKEVKSFHLRQMKDKGWKIEKKNINERNTITRSCVKGQPHPRSLCICNPN